MNNTIWFGGKPWRTVSITVPIPTSFEDSLVPLKKPKPTMRSHHYHTTHNVSTGPTGSHPKLRAHSKRVRSYTHELTPIRATTDLELKSTDIFLIFCFFSFSFSCFFLSNSLSDSNGIPEHQLTSL